MKVPEFLKRFLKTRPEVAQPQPEELTLDVRTIRLPDMFSTAGRFQYMGVFRSANISARNLINRRAILAAIATASPAEVQAVPEAGRRILAAFLAQEARRYHGTATRLWTTAYGKRGDPLPKLQFPSPQGAVGYRELLRAATNALVRSAIATARLTPA